MLCYVMLCYVILCYVILYYVILCYILNTFELHSIPWCRGPHGAKILPRVKGLLDTEEDPDVVHSIKPLRSETFLNLKSKSSFKKAYNII